MFVLFTTASGATFTGSVTTTVTSASLATQPVGSPIATFTDAMNAVRNGNAYFNVVTTANPTGEIRGQLGTTLLASTLSGASVVPPVTTTATGAANLAVTPSGNAVNTTVSVSGLPAGDTVTTITINNGAAGANGAPMFTVYDSSVSGAFPGTVSVPLTSANFVATPGSPITTYAQAVSAIQSGNAYILVNTTTNPTGELRGQTTSSTF